MIGSWRGRILAQKKQALARFKIAGLNIDSMVYEIPARVLAELSTDQFLQLLDIEHGPFELLDAAEQMPLAGLTMAIQTLLKAGATSSDFKRIYCQTCNFKPAKSLDRASFEEAYLAEADFSHLSLRGASFKEADIGGANFFDADLSMADMSSRRARQGLASKDAGHQLPLLECAKLAGTNLSGLPLLVYGDAFDDYGKYQLFLMPRMMQTQIDATTKLDRFSIIIASSVTDKYLKQHSSAPQFKSLSGDRDRAGWPNPLFKDDWFEPEYQRVRGTFAVDAERYARTIATKDLSLTVGDIDRLGQDAFWLRGHVDQPTLKALKLYSQFTEKIKGLKVPDTPEGKAASAYSRRKGGVSFKR
jgi:hypothetical protein